VQHTIIFLFHSSWFGGLDRVGALNQSIGFPLTESHRVASHVQNFSVGD
jgi:hypothetical protein